MSVSPLTSSGILSCQRFRVQGHHDPGLYCFWSHAQELHAYALSLQSLKSDKTSYLSSNQTGRFGRMNLILSLRYLLIQKGNATFAASIVIVS